MPFNGCTANSRRRSPSGGERAADRCSWQLQPFCSSLVLNGGQLRFDDDSDRAYAWASYEADRGDWRSRATLSYTQNGTHRADSMNDVLRSFGSLLDWRAFQMLRLQHSSTLTLKNGSELRWSTTSARGSPREPRFSASTSRTPGPRLENTFSPNTFLPELRADAVVVSPESSRMRGVDLYATAAFTPNVHGWLSYSHSRAVDVIDGADVPRAWDQPHALGVGLAAEGHAWSLSGNLFAHSGWPITPYATITWQFGEIRAR